MGCFLFLLWLQQLLQGPLNFQTNLKNFVAMPSVRNVRHVRLVYRWRKSAEPGWSIHLIHSPSIPDHLADALRSQRNAAELSLWSAKLVMLVSPRRNSAEETLTHLSALRRSNAAELSLWSAKLVTPVSPRRNSAEGTLSHLSALRCLPNHLILITATPRFGTRKSCMARWVPRSAAGRETGSASLSAMVVTRMIKLFCFCDFIPLAQFLFEFNKKARVNYNVESLF